MFYLNRNLKSRKKEKVRRKSVSLSSRLALSLLVKKVLLQCVYACRKNETLMLDRTILIRVLLNMASSKRCIAFKEWWRRALLLRSWEVEKFSLHNLCRLNFNNTTRARAIKKWCTWNTRRWVVFAARDREWEKRVKIRLNKRESVERMRENTCE